MTRKVRHPYQMLEASEMAIGKRYAFVTAYEGRSPLVSRYAMGGVFDDTRGAARQLGHELDSGKPQVGMLVADAPESVVTVHMDGWWPSGEDADYPTLMYWSGGNQVGWDRMSLYLGSSPPVSSVGHSIVVAAWQWSLDPYLHMVDWSNPDDVVERAIRDTPPMAEDAAGWERRMRAKAHAAMAKALGF